MRAWVVTDGDSGVFVRAPHPTRAKHFWPGTDDPAELTAERVDWLDGPGPAREIEPVRIECPHVAEGKIDREYEPCPWNCYDGVDRWEIIDKAATLRSLADGNGRG